MNCAAETRILESCFGILNVRPVTSCFFTLAGREIGLISQGSDLRSRARWPPNARGVARTSRPETPRGYPKRAFNPAGKWIENELFVIGTHWPCCVRRSSRHGEIRVGDIWFSVARSTVCHYCSTSWAANIMLATRATSRLSWVDPRLPCGMFQLL